MRWSPNHLRDWLSPSSFCTSCQHSSWVSWMHMAASRLLVYCTEVCICDTASPTKPGGLQYQLVIGLDRVDVTGDRGQSLVWLFKYIQHHSSHCLTIINGCLLLWLRYNNFIAQWKLVLHERALNRVHHYSWNVTWRYAEKVQVPFYRFVAVWSIQAVLTSTISYGLQLVSNLWLGIEVQLRLEPLWCMN